MKVDVRVENDATQSVYSSMMVTVQDKSGAYLISESFVG
jgi:hypothetical protein